jgi:hypothetical protein
MTDFSKTYAISRTRFTEAVEAFNAEQLNYRLHPGVLTIGEMALHVAGVEVWFLSQIFGFELDEKRAKLAKSATEGAVNDNPFPYKPEEITPEVVSEALAYTRELLQPHIDNPTPEFLAAELTSALGPQITGEGALARYSFHPGYHHGQVYLIATSPGFPK